jgi:hypothetical protein
MDKPKYEPSEEWLRLKRIREQRKARLNDTENKEREGNGEAGSMQAKIMMNPVKVVSAVTVLVAGVYYFASPYLAINSLRNGFLSKNPDQVSKYIDYPTLREDLKAQLGAAAIKNLQNDPQMASNPFSGVAMGMITPMINSMVDTYVTPSGMRTIFESNSSGQSGEDQTVQALADRKKEFDKNLQKTSMGYEGIGQFQLTVTSEDDKKTKFIFNRKGFSDWKLKTIVLPKT